MLDMAKVTLLFTTLVALCRYSEAVCYFPQELQGEFVMQTNSNTGTGIQYSNINVTDISISIWGNCHKRIGNNFILMLTFAEMSCIRCLHLKLRSANVLQVYTEILSKCYTNEESAEANCPSEESLTNRKAEEILLFKTKDAVGMPTRKEYCPIDGKFSVKYQSSDLDRPNQCKALESTMDSCPSGSVLNFRLRGCSLNNQDLKFECLGSWTTSYNENILILADNRKAASAQKVKYRCAFYTQDVKSGEVQMALSSDSTCVTDLINPQNGYETFVMAPKSDNHWPAEATFGTCMFPKWMYGYWEHVRVDGDTMVYKDHTSFKTYTIKCVGALEDKDKYLIFSRTQCDEELYNCMRIVKRANNIMEFKFGSNASSTKDVFMLCSDENFENDSWITQGRIENLEETSSGKCPVSGEYVGVIPDGVDLCAKLWSNCDTSDSSTDVMYYEVSHCKTQEIYEERIYKCLGHWRESDYLYTYTQRQDVASELYECFVGVKMSNREIFIREAGEHCQRHIDPLHYGMQLNKTSSHSCNYTTQRNPSTSVRTTKVATITRRPFTLPVSTTKLTTRVWNFDNEGAETKPSDNGSSASTLKSVYFLYIFVHSLIYLNV